MNVQICIYTLAGAPLCLQSMGTIWQLKLQIKEALGVPRRLQRLFSETREVANCEEVRSKNHRSSLLDISEVPVYSES